MDPTTIVYMLALMQTNQQAPKTMMPMCIEEDASNLTRVNEMCYSMNQGNSFVAVNLGTHTAQGRDKNHPDHIINMLYYFTDGHIEIGSWDA